MRKPEEFSDQALLRNNLLNSIDSLIKQIREFESQKVILESRLKSIC